MPFQLSVKLKRTGTEPSRTRHGNKEAPFWQSRLAARIALRVRENGPAEPEPCASGARASVAAREAIPAPTGSRWVFLPRSLRIAQTRSEEGIESHLFSRANHFPSGRAVALTFLPSPATRTHPNSVVKRVFANPAGFFLPRSLRIAQTHTFQLAGNTRFTTLFGRVRVADIPYTFPISVIFNLTLS